MPDLAGEVASGDLERSLIALRDQLALEIQNGVACKACGGAVSSPTAALAKQLRDTLAQLAAIAKPERSVSGDLKQQRADRHAGMAKRAPRGKQQRAGGDRTSG